MPDPSDAPGAEELARLRRECAFYRRALELSGRGELEPLLAEALALIREVSGARRGYIELRVPSQTSDEPAFWLAHGCPDEVLERVRATLSRGIIAESLATGRTIVTASAMVDPRYAQRGSVLANRIEAVLCAPIGATPPLGVLYLQDREVPGVFTEDDRRRAEVFAAHLALLAEHLLAQQRPRVEADPTRPYRDALRADDLIGRSPAMVHLLKQLALIAPLDVAVLLTGPSGTGKTHVARVLHASSPRAAGNFVALNCANLPESLVENELFGAAPGAHSTAARSVEGKVGAASGGTLFLDEIAELSLPAQAKLLQLLQSREYYPLGASKPRAADVRVIAATNADLQAAVARRAFREDLYWRLHVLPLRVPALAERREDVPDLAAHFCGRACERNRLPRVRLSRKTVLAAQAAEWPGNIRQLEHAIEAAAIRAVGDGSQQIEPRHLFPDASADDDGPPDPPSYQEATRRFQAQLLRSTLQETGWNVAEAARRLDLTRAHVYNLIQSFGLARP